MSKICTIIDEWLQSFYYADQEMVGVKIPLNKGGSGGCVFLLK